MRGTTLAMSKVGDAVGIGVSRTGVGEKAGEAVLVGGRGVGWVDVGGTALAGAKVDEAEAVEDDRRVVVGVGAAAQAESRQATREIIQSKFQAELHDFIFMPALLIWECFFWLMDLHWRITNMPPFVPT